MYKLTKELTIAVALSANMFLSAQNADKQSQELLEQSRLLVEQNDLEKAKLSLSLYQKYVETNVLKWLEAQMLLIEVAFEERNSAEAKNLIVTAEQKIKDNKLTTSTQSKQLKLLESDYYLFKNDFKQSNKILQELIAKYNYEVAHTRLINNLIDKGILNSCYEQKVDVTSIEEKISAYEKNPDKNPLELIRIKNKYNILNNPSNETLESIQKSSEFWIQKDEILILEVYLLLTSNKNKDAYEIWQDQKDILNIKSHPATVKVISMLAHSFASKQAKKSFELSKFARLLVRDTRDLGAVVEVQTRLHIEENKTAEALSTVESFLKTAPKAKNADLLRIMVCEQLIKDNDLQQCVRIFRLVDRDSISNSALKSRATFIEAVILQRNGKEKDAAALFLRVGQMAQDPELIISSLYQAGISFENANQHQKAIIAFKQLISKPRHKLTDSSFHKLYNSQALAGDYAGALSSIESILKQGRTPTLKKDALFDKGHILLKSGNTTDAITAFQDFAVVYPQDSKSAELLFEVYNIQKKKLKELKSAGKTLEKIIEKTSEIAPSTYSLALHHRALLYQLNGNTRKSIELWQKYLEFNQKLPHPLIDEVKLHLAAAYQNSSEFSSTAAGSIYADIMSNSSDSATVELALVNLASLPKNEENFERAVLNLLNSKAQLSDKMLEPIFVWLISLDSTKQKKEILRVNQQLSKLISSQKALDSFWMAQSLFIEGKLAKDSQKRSKALKKALDLNSQSKMNAIQKYEQRIKLYQSLKDQNGQVSEYLNLIYHFQQNMANDNYLNWELYHSACLKVAKLLKKQNKSAQIEALIKRISKAQLPGYENIVTEMAKVLKGENK
ncbi:MAG: tetratricopeptide repeat protein [Lentisphaeraceae bacterium]|nr:tetratricopeptide repeat protein [Lentisphaeraceae bacterium]